MEWVVVAIAAIIVAALLAVFGVRRLLVRAYSEADAKSRANTAESAAKRRVKADEISKRPLPSNSEMDAWDRLE